MPQVTGCILSQTPTVNFFDFTIRVIFAGQMNLAQMQAGLVADAANALLDDETLSRVNMLTHTPAVMNPNRPPVRVVSTDHVVSIQKKRRPNRMTAANTAFTRQPTGQPLPKSLNHHISLRVIYLN